MQLGLLLPSTPLPSGWSIDPVTGSCVRLSDGARLGPRTSFALAWSTGDIAERLPDASGLALDVARLANAIGCAADGGQFTGITKKDRALADAVHAIAAEVVGNGSDAWAWRPSRPVAAEFNQRLGCFFDEVGVERASVPVAGLPAAEARWLVGRIGRLAIRSVVIVGDGAVARVEVAAIGCTDAGSAMHRARGWAIEAARAALVVSAAAVLAFVQHIAYHAHDAACIEVGQRAEQILAQRADSAVP